jgi:hypothetical protein
MPSRARKTRSLPQGRWSFLDQAPLVRQKVIDATSSLLGSRWSRPSAQGCPDARVTKTWDSLKDVVPPEDQHLL